MHADRSKHTLAMSDPSLSPSQALGRWALHVIIFIVAGGVAAGLSALAYQAIAQTKTPLGIYAVIFAASGVIAYRLSEQVISGPNG